MGLAWLIVGAKVGVVGEGDGREVDGDVVLEATPEVFVLFIVGDVYCVGF